MHNKGIFIGRSSPFHIYAANKLFDSGIISSVIFEESNSVSIKDDPKFIDLNPKNFYLEIVWGKKEFHNQRILKSNYKDLNKKINFYKINNINCDDAFHKIKEINPSLVIVHGTKITKEKFFQNICVDFINIYWGMSPDYQGDGITTPIYFQDWRKLGFTVHKIDKGTDLGEIICKDKIDIDEEDNFYSIGLKMTKKAIEYLTNGLILENKINDNCPLLKQDLSKGVVADTSFLRKNIHIRLFSPLNLKIKQLQIKFFRKSKIILKSLIGIFTYPFINKSDVVFLFHEVTNSPSEFAIDNDLFIDNKKFEEQINWIAKKYRVLDPIELVNGSNITSNNHKKNALITFDDGSASIFENAAPILRKYGLKAIVFLNMGPIKEEDFYSGLICYLNSKDYCFKLNMKKVYPQRSEDFLFFNISDIENFSYAIKTKNFSNKLKKYHGSFTNIAQLNRNNDVFVYGSHFYNHFNAVNLTKSELALQIEKNSKELKNINGNPELFSYPFGQPDSCYNSETDKEILNLGVKKIFYANIMKNTSFSNTFFYRVATGNIFNLGYMKFVSIFLPFFKQLVNDLKNKY